MEEHHRIRWYRSSEVAKVDKLIFGQWERGEISAIEAARMIARNNNTIVTVDMFLANAKALGYKRVLAEKV